jgi:hypothetical protein
MSNNKAFKVKNGLELADYNKSISDTAVDVFVYDTRKDSDGGAWRKRTQHTSWYNETLNTATRGSRKEFPAVAVIVAEAGTVTIYDGDDPDLPMWMALSITGFATLSSISAVNGLVVVGRAANGGGAFLINYIEDTVFRHNESGSGFSGYLLTNIAGAADGTFTSWDGSADNTLVDGNINDVAMTVLPNAPIDPATGLPVPTIAIASDGGVSVIRDDGTVVDITANAGNVWEAVGFYGNRIAALHDSRREFLTLQIPNADTNIDTVSIDLKYDETSAPYVNAVASNAGSAVNGLFPNIDETLVYVARNEGRFVIVDENVNNKTSGMAAWVSNNYNTGWMNGDIKLATLSDTDDTDVTGSELVTNGDFATGDLTGWTDKSTGSGTATVNGSNQLELYRPDGSNIGWAQQAITTVSGARYLLTVNEIADGGAIFIGSSDGGSDIYGASAASGVNIVMFTATSTTTYIGLRASTNGSTSVYDDVSVRLAEEDRSVNGNGLQVFGSITKDPVATGADLVAYSGFSSSNYLEQPYNSDLDFGTGDFCVMGWYKTSNTTAGNEILFARVDSGNAAAINIIITSSETLTLQTRESSTSSTTTTTETAPTGVWNYFAFVRRNSGTVQEVYINGKLSISATVTARNMSSSTGKVYLGYTPELASNAKGSMALWRISATAPTAEQIAKIYEDEKFLFQENAQATLYGSSDAVTALAYDDSTELLHVGTSNGRSVFQGLRRVDNTTTAVGAAISASNGLVAED